MPAETPKTSQAETRTQAANGAGAAPPAESSGNSDLMSALRAENDLLRQRLRQQEEDYNRLAYAYLREKCQNFTEQDFRPEDYTLSMEDVLAELEKMPEGK